MSNTQTNSSRDIRRAYLKTWVRSQSSKSFDVFSEEPSKRNCEKYRAPFLVFLKLLQEDSVNLEPVYLLDLWQGIYQNLPVLFDHVEICKRCAKLVSSNLGKWFLHAAITYYIFYGETVAEPLEFIGNYFKLHEKGDFVPYEMLVKPLPGTLQEKCHVSFMGVGNEKVFRLGEKRTLGQEGITEMACRVKVFESLLRNSLPIFNRSSKVAECLQTFIFQDPNEFISENGVIVFKGHALNYLEFESLPRYRNNLLIESLSAKSELKITPDFSSVTFNLSQYKLRKYSTWVGKLLSFRILLQTSLSKRTFSDPTFRKAFGPLLASVCYLGDLMLLKKLEQYFRQNNKQKIFNKALLKISQSVSHVKLTADSKSKHAVEEVYFSFLASPVVGAILGFNQNIIDFMMESIGVQQASKFLSSAIASARKVLLIEELQLSVEEIKAIREFIYCLSTKHDVDVNASGRISFFGSFSFG